MQEVGAVTAEVHCCASVPKVVPDLQCSMHCMFCVRTQDGVEETVDRPMSLCLTQGLAGNDTCSLLAPVQAIDT